MNLSKKSTFPLHKPFERQDSKTSLSQVGLRLVVNFFSDEPYVIGTATVVTGNLLLTAKHVLNDISDTTRMLEGPSVEINGSLSAFQLLPGPEYIVWNVADAIVDPVSDLALLKLDGSSHRSDTSATHEWKALRVNPFAPELGERVAAFGYRHSTIHTSKNLDGSNHIDLDDDPMVGVGLVREIFEMRRDQRLPFPCYQVSARFDAGMSGGPVFDETGSLCGLICSNVDGSHLTGEPISYVTTLWPLFRLMVDFDRGDRFPRRINYPALDLARGGQIKVTDLPRLEKWFAEHIT